MVMRRLGFAVVLMSMMVAACGRIVTVPKTSTGVAAPAGNMFIRVRTVQTLDFTGGRYIVVFNTSGNGVTPLATQIASFSNYSFELIFGGTNVGGASYQLLQIVPSGTSAGYQQISVPIQQQYVTNFNPNSNGTNTEFTFTFNRLLLTPIATPSPSAAPTAPTPSPGPNPTLQPGVSTLWAMNVFSTDPSGNPIDGIATNGVQDVTFKGLVIDTTQPVDDLITKPLAAAPQVNPEVSVVEVINAP